MTYEVGISCNWILSHRVYKIDEIIYSWDWIFTAMKMKEEILDLLTSETQNNYFIIIQT